MKTELRTTPHTEFRGHTTVELWHGGKLIGTLTGADGPGVRVITPHKIVIHGIDPQKHPNEARMAANIGVRVLDVMIGEALLPAGGN